MDTDIYSMLSQIAQSPRKSQYFTHYRDGASKTAKSRLKRLEELGFVFEKNGQYSITNEGRKSLDSIEFARPKLATNQYTVYKPGDGDIWFGYQRPGSDHSHIKSRGWC